MRVPFADFYFNTKDGHIGDQIRELTGGLGAECGAECVGYQCHNSRGKEVPNLVMNSLVDAVKATGTLGIIGVYVPQDPHASDKLAKIGQTAFDLGKFWFKGLRMGTGQCNVKAYNRRLMDLIHHGKANPSMIISHEIALDDAADAYEHLDNRDAGGLWSLCIPKQLDRTRSIFKSLNRFRSTGSTAS